ncbi:MAG: SDR family NAD(P)-dependent oxidoreductase [Candidatus Hydrogenedentes bacterium]|nr:SDR family NAD(P)-dependent oxidoreductase [Candidatus Hydrogenedentota bacterium]
MASQQVVLISGCSSGIGRALALAFAKAGHRVYATARRLDTLADLEREGIRTCALDVTDAESIAHTTASVAEDAGRIDILVNNAGFGLINPMIDVPLEKLRLLMETNVIGAVALMQAVAPHMIRQRHGCIVQIGSVSGILTTPFAGSYCASKAALHALSESARMELAPFGVHVLIVQPGGVKSRLGDKQAEHVHLPEGSAYVALSSHLEARAQYSQIAAAAAEKVAAQIVNAATRARPPRVLRVGHGGYRYPLFKRLVPAAILERVLMKKFGLNEP